MVCRGKDVIRLRQVDEYLTAAKNIHLHGSIEEGCVLLKSGIPGAPFPTDLSDEENVRVQRQR